MNYAQHLPTYTHGFLEAPWVEYDSPHYVYFVFLESLAEEEIEKIIATQESAYAKIVNFLGIHDGGSIQKIRYYLYPDAETKMQLMGDDWYAQAIYSEWCVHALYTQEHRVIGPHEDTHLLALPLGMPVGFIHEGLAEYMVGHDWFCNDLRKTAQEGVVDIQIPVDSSLLVSHQSWLNTDDKYARHYYALAGAFVDFLLEHYGKEKFLQCYQQLSRENSLANTMSYEKNFEIGYDVIWDNFISTLKKWG